MGKSAALSNSSGDEEIMEVKTEPGLCAVCGEPPEEHSEEEKQKCLDKASAGR